jgi:hypothetical protein
VWLRENGAARFARGRALARVTPLFAPPEDRSIVGLARALELTRAVNVPADIDKAWKAECERPSTNAQLSSRCHMIMIITATPRSQSR